MRTGTNMDDKRKHLEITRDAWDAYHPDYMEFHLKEWPNYFEHFKGGGTMLDDYVVEMLGCVTGLSLLDICCACDAKQAFSWANLGAAVTACDISPAAIKIARGNAKRIGLNIDFHVADAQTLESIPDNEFDIVFATYLMWYEDIPLACRNWRRVLRPGGRLLIHTLHPVSYCIGQDSGRLVAKREYQDTRPIYYDFTGTPLADRQGGWEQRKACVEFHHTLADILNAAVDAGFHLEKTVEASPNSKGVLASFPGHVAMLWSK